MNILVGVFNNNEDKDKCNTVIQIIKIPSRNP